MTLLNAIAQRPALNPVVQGADQQNAAAAVARQNLASAKQVAAAAPAGTGGSDDSVSLSRQALDARVEQLGDQSIAAAQGFLQQFATSLFGDAARGASFDFDSVSVSADTSLSTATLQSSQQDGSGSTTLQAAALRFDESASFVGHGTLQTRDGQSYEFDIAVDYQATYATSSASASTADKGGNAPAADTRLDPTPEQTLVGKQLPPVKYPGSLADLFKLLGRQLDVSTGNGDQNGQLSLRLIRLVNSAALLAPRAHSDNGDHRDSAAAPSAAQRNRALAQYAPSEAALPAAMSAVDQTSATAAAFSTSA